MKTYIIKCNIERSVNEKHKYSWINMNSSYDIFYADGKVKEYWNTPNGVKDKKRLPLSDFSNIGVGICVNEKGKSLIYDLVKNYVQFLPINIEEIYLQENN